MCARGCVSESRWVGSLAQGAMCQGKELCLPVAEVSHVPFCRQAAPPQEVVQSWESGAVYSKVSPLPPTGH